MPGCLILHVGNALALNRLCDDCGGHALYGACFLKSLTDVVKIMSVNGDYMEIEGFKLLVDRIRVVDLRDVAVNLKIVVVYDDAEVGQLLRAGEQSGFQYLSFLQLTIAEESVNTVILLVHLSCQSHTARCGNALSQRSG